MLAPTATVVEFKAPSWGMYAAMVGMVLAGLGIGYQIVYMQADYWYLVTMIASEDDARVKAAEKAVSLNPYNDMYRAEVGVAYRDRMISYLNAAQQAQAAGQDATELMNQAQTAYETSVASLKDTIEFVPWEYDNYVFLASVHNIGGQALNPAYYDDAVAIGAEGRGGRAIRPGDPHRTRAGIQRQGRQHQGHRAGEDRRRHGPQLRGRVDIPLLAVRG